MDLPDNYNLPSIEQHERISLEKNAKGYKWEIKVFPDPKVEPEISDKLWLDRLEFLNNEMQKRFGGV